MEKMLKLKPSSRFKLPPLKRVKEYLLKKSINLKIYYIKFN